MGLGPPDRLQRQQLRAVAASDLLVCLLAGPPAIEYKRDNSAI